ncbi:SURF1 family protein [Legionella spiritensis]|uniref:SURF1-like protein n=1 Tax=Legionella spiritensis TaxID=452 RepID=A0A0W0Z8T7_LEGSP|nr:SURF1 family protein [Legionella spiritensis]KTD65549.1 SURF1 family protein [Legionella spiritensis]SNV44533.1 Uncharacterized conserved protein [Legionella spiritensis]VEG90823.1 Uncharacterized conserved protein [Legionella spiritensis]
MSVFIRRRFRPHWGMTLLTLFVVVLFSSLGYWQITRAHEKKRIVLAQKHMAQQMVVRWRPDETYPAQFQPISVSGHYLPQVFFLDNQHHRHQWGYHVISPLVLENQQVVLVDRGWVAGSPDRQQLPDVLVPEKSLTISGMSYYPSNKNWVLGEAIEPRNGDRFILEKIDAKLISQVLHKSIYPFIIRLDEQAMYGYVRQWAVIAMSPERHYGYALQWFAMAFTVLLIYIVLTLKKMNETI